MNNTPFLGGVIDVDAGLAFSSENIMERKGGMSQTGVLRIWDLATGKSIEEFGLPARIVDYCLSRESQRIAIFGAPGNRDDTHPFIAVYDYGARSFVYLTPPGRIDAPAFSKVVFGPDADTVWLGPDNRFSDMDPRCFAISGDRTTQVQPLSKSAFDAQLTASIQVPPPSLQLLDVIDIDEGVALVKKETHGVGYGHIEQVQLREVDTGLPLMQMGDDALPIAGYAFSPSGSHLAAWQGGAYFDEGSFYLWDFHEMNFRIFSDLEEFAGEKKVENAVISEDGTAASIVLGSGYEDRGGSGKEIVRLSLEGDTLKEVSRLSGLEKILWDEDQNAAVVWQGEKILDYDAARGDSRHLATGRESEWIVSFSPDRRFFWREYRRENLINSTRDEDWLRAQGVELVNQATRRVVMQLPARSSGVIQNIQVHYREEGMLVGSEVKLATGGFTHSELNWIGYDGAQRSFPISEPDGAMLIWSGLIESQGGTFACAARSNGIIESFDFGTGVSVSSFRDPEVEGWFEHLSLPATIAERRRYLLPRDDGGIRVMRVSPNGKPERVADVLLSANNNWLIRTESGHYWTSPGGERKVMIETERGSFPISHLDLAFHRPHVVANELGAPDETIEELELLWRARLQRHGMEVDTIPDPDRISFIEPIERIPFAAPSRDLRIQFKLNGVDQKNARLHILVNGVPVHSHEGVSVQSVNAEAQVQLSTGLNEIEAFVREESGLESVHWRGNTWLSATASSSDKPALHILAVGVSDYANGDSFDLEYAAKDASDLSSRLAAMAEKNGFRESDVHLVTDREATRSGILAAAKHLQHSGPDDTTIVFLAGHGVVTESGAYFFGTTDINFESPETTGLSYQDIQSLYDHVPARRRFVFIDTCHAGELEKSELSELRNDPQLAARGVKIRALSERSDAAFAQPTRLVRNLFSDIRLDTGAHVLCAAQGAEIALESAETKNGLFTHFLLEEIESGTADLDGDGHILAPELINAVAEEVSGLTQGVQNPVSRESNDSLPFSLWPASERVVDPIDVLDSYLELSASAKDAGKRKLAISMFAPAVRYFGNVWSQGRIDQDMKDYCGRYHKIEYEADDVKVEKVGSDEVTLLYTLNFHVQSEPKQDPRTYRFYHDVDKKGAIPSRMVLRREGIGWKIHELVTR